MTKSQTLQLKAPFPAFGGKSRAAELVWDRLGDVANYIEPFAYSSAVLLRRPVDHRGTIETINDANQFVANFWRAVCADPDAVAKHCDWPVSEVDLHSRHEWLMRGRSSDEFIALMARDPEHYDAKVAGWWCWGQCCWIGGGWCSAHGQTADGGLKKTLPDYVGRGVESAKRPRLASGGRAATKFSTQIPHLAGDSGAAGTGVTSTSPKLPDIGGHANGTGRGVSQISGGRPQLGDAYDIGRGVTANGKAVTCDQRLVWLTDWMYRLRDRLRLVRTCYGDWERVCGSRTTTTRIGTTGVFLDPPYSIDIARMHAWVLHLMGEGDKPEPVKTKQRHDALYASDKSHDVDHLVARVHVWCRKHTADPEMRIAVCGYEGEHDELESMGWQVVPWRASGGYGNRGGENKNRDRERIWFSPHCIDPSSQGFVHVGLFDEVWGG